MIQIRYKSHWIVYLEFITQVFLEYISKANIEMYPIKKLITVSAFLTFIAGTISAPIDKEAGYGHGDLTLDMCMDSDSGNLICIVTLQFL